MMAPLADHSDFAYTKILGTVDSKVKVRVADSGGRYGVFRMRMDRKHLPHHRVLHLRCMVTTEKTIAIAEDLTIGERLVMEGRLVGRQVSLHVTRMWAIAEPRSKDTIENSRHPGFVADDGVVSEELIQDQISMDTRSLPIEYGPSD
jgi:hypothetical protein